MYINTAYNRDDRDDCDRDDRDDCDMRHRDKCHDKCHGNRPFECSDVDCQSHVHEYLGSTRIAEANVDPHNHRFAGVTSEAIQSGRSHVHQLLGNTDFYENHHHEVGARTGEAIWVGEGRHIHFVSGTTTCDDGHMHDFIFGTLIDNPIGD